jgi:hypothetical protein
VHVLTVRIDQTAQPTALAPTDPTDTLDVGTSQLASLAPPALGTAHPPASTTLDASQPALAVPPMLSPDAPAECNNLALATIVLLIFGPSPGLPPQMVSRFCQGSSAVPQPETGQAMTLNAIEGVQRLKNPSRQTHLAV